MAHIKIINDTNQAQSITVHINGERQEISSLGPSRTCSFSRDGDMTVVVYRSWNSVFWHGIVQAGETVVLRFTTAAGN